MSIQLGEAYRQAIVGHVPISCKHEGENAYRDISTYRQSVNSIGSSLVGRVLQSQKKRGFESQFNVSCAVVTLAGLDWLAGQYILENGEVSPIVLDLPLRDNREAYQNYLVLDEAELTDWQKIGRDKVLDKMKTR